MESGEPFNPSQASNQHPVNPSKDIQRVLRPMLFQSSSGGAYISDISAWSLSVSPLAFKCCMSKCPCFSFDSFLWSTEVSCSNCCFQFRNGMWLDHDGRASWLPSQTEQLQQRPIWLWPIWANLLILTLENGIAGHQNGCCLLVKASRVHPVQRSRKRVGQCPQMPLAWSKSVLLEAREFLNPTPSPGVGRPGWMSVICASEKRLDLTIRREGPALEE